MSPTAKTLIASGLILLVFCLRVGAGESSQPNILLITADDLGLQLSCYGEKNIKTPVLDGLAREGVRFSKAYVAQASCSSSRAALLTGRWPHENGQVGLAHLGFRMADGLPNLPALLHAGGYRTGIIGKLHVEPAGEYPFDWKPAGKGVAAGPTRDVKWVAEQSREFLTSAKAAGKPFFYYVNYFDPHGPLTPETDQVGGLPERPLKPDDVVSPLPFRSRDEKAQRVMTARYMNTVLRLDAGLRLLLAELEAADFARNTLVIYIGDNGLAGVRGKTTSYELGVRVPMLVRWPGVARPGEVCDQPVSLLDLMPTILDAAGIAAPDRLAGQPLQPLLRGEPVKWRELLMTEMNFHEPQQFRPQRTVRDARYKLLLNLLPEDGQAPIELFDLERDPWETQNLADRSELKGTRERLESQLQAWRERTGDPLLEAARVVRWADAARHWGTLPPQKRGAARVVTIPPGDLQRLK